MDGMVLTEDARAEHDEWQMEHHDRGCTCFLSPPCSFCTHPGHPLNLNETPEAWTEPDEEDDDGDYRYPLDEG